MSTLHQGCPLRELGEGQGLQASSFESGVAHCLSNPLGQVPPLLWTLSSLKNEVLQKLMALSLAKSATAAAGSSCLPPELEKRNQASFYLVGLKISRP